MRTLAPARRRGLIPTSTASHAGLSQQRVRNCSTAGSELVEPNAPEVDPEVLLSGELGRATFPTSVVVPHCSIHRFGLPAASL